MTTKAFHIGDILSVTSGRFCSVNGIGGLYDLLNWMTGGDLMTHELPGASRECAPNLREQHPDVAAVFVPRFVDEAEGRAWVAEQVARFGETREVAPLRTAGVTR